MVDYRLGIIAIGIVVGVFVIGFIYAAGSGVYSDDAETESSAPLQTLIAGLAPSKS